LRAAGRGGPNAHSSCPECCGKCLILLNINLKSPTGFCQNGVAGVTAWPEFTQPLQLAGRSSRERIGGRRVCLGRSPSRPQASARAVPAVCCQYQRPSVTKRVAGMAQSTVHVMIRGTLVRELISRDLHHRRWRTWERGVGSCGGGDARNDSSGGARLTKTGVAGKGSCFQVWRVDGVTEVGYEERRVDSYRRSMSEPCIDSVGNSVVNSAGIA
jgi:hypothetical protein